MTTSATLSFSGNGVVALDPETHRVGIEVVDVKGDVHSTAIGWSASASGLSGTWRHDHRRQPGADSAGGASLLAIGNNGAVEIDELVTPDRSRRHRLR